MKQYFRRFASFLAVLVLVLIAGPTQALAAAATPTMDKANITVTTQGSNETNVTEKITLSSVNVAKGGTLQFILANPPSGSVSNLSITSSSVAMKVSQKQEQAVTKVSVPVPAGAKTLNLIVQYTISSSATHVPLLVPLYNAKGSDNSVNIAFRVPSGMQLHSAVPYYTGPKTGMIHEGLVAMPSFVSFNYGATSSMMTYNGVVSLITFLLIMGAISVWAFRSSRGAGGVRRV
jgi:hypothetical protein